MFQVHIEFNDDQNKIVIEGPPEEVTVVEAKIKEQKNELVSLHCSFHLPEIYLVVWFWNEVMTVMMILFI